MPRVSHLCAALVLLTMSATAAANDLNEACHGLARAEMIFVGRVKSAPITRRISGEEEIDKARLVMDEAERDLKAFEALKMPPEIGAQRNRDLAIRFAQAHAEWGRIRAMYPPLVDFVLTPIVVEVPLRGVPTTELFLQGPVPLEPGRSYLFYAQRPLGRIAPDVISLAGRPKEAESAEADLQFLNDAIANDPGTAVSGSLRLDTPGGLERSTPLAGVILRISLDDQHFEASTRADGTFTFEGVPSGRLTIEPLLPSHIVVPPQSVQTRGGCVDVHMRAKFDGRIRGRVLLDDGTAFRGLVDIVSDDPGQQQAQFPAAATNERGEFVFSALSPGPYLVGVNIARQPTGNAPFLPTYFPGVIERSQATSVIVGVATEQAELEWVVNARLREGSIAVSFNTNGQPQKEMGVCVTTFDSDNRNRGGVGYGPRPGEPLIVKVIEGVKYRLEAWARTSSGFAESEIFDVIGAPGHREVTLAMTSVSERTPGARCASSHSGKPFSP